MVVCLQVKGAWEYFDNGTCRFIADKDFVALQTLKFESMDSAGFQDKDNAGMISMVFLSWDIGRTMPACWGRLS